MDPVESARGVLLGTGIAFGIVALVRGRALFALRWAPDRHVTAAIGTGLLAVAFSAAILIVPGSAWAGRALHFVGIYVVCGCALPWWYVLRVERAGAAGLGLTRAGAGSALIVGLVCGGGLFARVLVGADFSGVDPGYLVRASYSLLVGGLFETFLYYGFLHRRLDRAFGPIPAIVGSAAIYSLWHVGTELPMHDDPWGGILLLFAVGLLYHTVFQLTRHLLSIWPFFFAGGVWNDFALVLDFPERMAQGMGWVSLAAICMVAIPVWLLRGERQSDS